MASSMGVKKMLTRKKTRPIFMKPRNRNQGGCLMKTQSKTLFAAVLFLCFLGFGSISTASSNQEVNIWTIVKSGDVDHLTLALGQQYVVNFKIVVDLPNRLSPPAPADTQPTILNVSDTTKINPLDPGGYLCTVY